MLGSMSTWNVTDVGASLSELLARVEKGEEVILAREGQPVARIVPFPTSTAPRSPGSARGRIQMRDDFDDPLPVQFTQAFR